ncbi:MAG: TonB family protein [Gammaproteobacteria bacterium]|nr:TonB family protein [Gammaproteobacteria bacterium]
MSTARARFDPKRPDAALAHFRRASALLAADADVCYRGLKNYDIATELVRRGGTAWSRPFVEAAHAVFSEHLQPYDVRRGLMAYHLGLWTEGDERPDLAVGRFEDALTAFETKGEMGDLERTVRMRLVDILERTGRSDEATPHCLALGAAEDWRMPPRPLFMTYPRYATEAFEGLSEGQVTLGFTIDEEGFVRDPRVLESTRPSLDEGALAAVGGFRYAPRFVDGASVRTDDVTFTYSFDFASSSRESDRRTGFMAGFDLSMPPPRGSMSGAK